MTISEARPCVEQAFSAPFQNAVVTSASMDFRTMAAPPTFQFVTSGSTPRIFLIPAPQSNQVLQDRAVVFCTLCGKEYRICRKTSTNAQRTENNTTVSIPANPPTSKVMRVVHVFRLLFENSVHSFRDANLFKKENRRAGRRTLLRLKDTFTLAEWHALVARVRQVSSGHVSCSPVLPSINRYGFAEKEMTLEVVDYLALMHSLGHFDTRKFVRYICMARKLKRRGKIDAPLIVRLIGDYVCEEPGPAPSHQTGDSSNSQCLITLGSSISCMSNASMFSTEHRCVILRRPSCEWDPRDRAYVVPMEIDSEFSRLLLPKLKAETREKNKVLCGGGEKRKRVQDRFLGYRWKRLSRMVTKTLFFDDKDADEVVGEIQLCIPTLTFCGGATASEINRICEQGSLLNLFSGTEVSSRNNTTV